MPNHDMITAFNCITEKHNADRDSIFNDIIEYHYEKYRYFYHILSSLRQSSIKDIFGEIEDSVLIIAIEPTSIDQLPKLYKAINKSKDNYILSTSFNLDMEETGSIIYLRFSLAPDIESEDSIHEA